MLIVLQQCLLRHMQSYTSYMYHPFFPGCTSRFCPTQGGHFALLEATECTAEDPHPIDALIAAARDLFTFTSTPDKTQLRKLNNDSIEARNAEKIVDGCDWWQLEQLESEPMQPQILHVEWPVNVVYSIAGSVEQSTP